MEYEADHQLTYDYNFDAFGVAEGAKRVECRCGAVNCVGYLGRKSGEKSAKQIALDMEAEANARAKVQEIRSKRSRPALNDGSIQPTKPVNSRSTSKEDPPAVKAKTVPPANPTKAATSTRLQPILPAPPKSKNAESIAGPSSTKPAKLKGKGRESAAGPSKPRSKKHEIEKPAFTGIMIGGRPIAAKIAECMTSTPRIYQRKRKSESQITDGTELTSIAIPPPVDFYRSPDKIDAKANTTTKIDKGKQPEIRPKIKPKPVSSMPMLTARTTWKIMPQTRKIVPKPRTVSDVPSAFESSSLTSLSPPPDDREPSPVPLFVPRKGRRKKEPEGSAAAASTLGTGQRPVASSSKTVRGPQANDSERDEYDEAHDDTGAKKGRGTKANGASNEYYRSPAWLEANERELAEKPRTLEEWNHLRGIRRRRPDWVDRMMEQYGSLPGPGHPGNVGSVVSEQLLADKRKEALDAGIDITASKKRKAEAEAEASTGTGNEKSRRKSEPNRKITIKFSRKSEPALGSTSMKADNGATAQAVDHGLESDSGESENENSPPSRRPRSGTPAREAREAAIRAKREAIEKRNGAPKGWAYEVVPLTAPPAPVEQEPEELTRGSRRRHTINYNEGR